MIKNYLYLSLFIFLNCTPIFSNTPYKKNNLNFIIPNEWVVTKNPSQRGLFLSNIETVATINIRTYTYEEPVTANGFQIKSMSARYDGWLNLFERMGSDYETEKANADESYIAVYSKKVLQPDLSIEKLIVGEYYYTQENKAYVVSIATPQNNWKKIQASLKTIIQSFWIGKGDRPTPPLPEKKENNDWEMIGKNKKNQNYIDANPPLSKIIDVAWHKELSEPLFLPSESLPKPVIANNTVFYNINKHLYSISLKTGELNWDYTLGGQLTKNLISHNGILYLIQEGSPHYLYALANEDGKILYKKKLSSHNHSHPILSEKTLFIVDDKFIKAFDSDTGKVRWIKNYNLNPSFYPVISQQKIILVDKNNNLLALNETNGNLLWKQDMKAPLLYTPSLVKNHILTINQSNQTHLIRSLNLDNGETEWEFSHADLNITVTAPPSTSPKKLFVPTQLSSRYLPNSDNITVVMSFDISTGDLIWQKQLLDKKSPLTVRPIVTKQSVLVDISNTPELFTSLDLLTGATIPTKLAENINRTNNTILSTRLYQGHVLTLELNKNILTMICYQ